jgi:uncharacterized protein involved in exopolysaccharide biosynthesis
MTNPASDKAIDLRHYAKILWRRKGLLVLSTVSVFCTALIALAFMPKEYESRVRFLFDEEQALIRELEQVMGGSGRGSSREIERSRLVGIAARIRSRPFLERVVRSLGMANDPEVQARAAERQADTPDLTVDEIAMRMVVDAIQSRVRFSSLGAGFYEIVVTDYDPRNAQVLAQWISSLFDRDTKTRAAEQIDNALRFAADQLAVYQEELRKSEEKLERYQESEIAADLSPSAVRSRNLGTAEILQRRIRRDADDAFALITPFESTLRDAGMRSLVESVLGTPQVQSITGRLETALMSSVDDYLAMEASSIPVALSEIAWPRQYLDVRQDLSTQLAEASRRLAPDAVPRERDALASYVFYHTDWKVNSNVADWLERRIQDFAFLAKNQPGSEFELKRLEDEVARNKRMLQIFQEQEMASGMRKAMENASLGLQVEITDPPDLPLSPSRPNRMKILLAALLLGPLVGSGFAFLAEVMDSTLRTLDEIQRVAPEPILCTTPLLSKLRRQSRGWRRYWVPVTTSAVILLTVLFFVARMTVLQDVISVGQPVQIVTPNSMSDETRP